VTRTGTFGADGGPVVVDEGADFRFAVKILSLVQNLQVVECSQDYIHPFFCLNELPRLEVKPLTSS